MGDHSGNFQQILFFIAKDFQPALTATLVIDAWAQWCYYHTPVITALRSILPGQAHLGVHASVGLLSENRYHRIDWANQRERVWGVRVPACETCHQTRHWHRPGRIDLDKVQDIKLRCTHGLQHCAPENAGTTIVKKPANIQRFCTGTGGWWMVVKDITPYLTYGTKELYQKDTDEEDEEDEEM